MDIEWCRILFTLRPVIDERLSIPSLEDWGGGGGGGGGKKVKARRVSITVRMRIGEEVRTRP